MKIKYSIPIIEVMIVSAENGIAESSIQTGVNETSQLIEDWDQQIFTEDLVF